MKLTRKIVVLDAPDLEVESTFWAALLGGEVVRDDVDDDWHSITVDGAWTLGIQLAPDHVPPTWPADGVPQQLHLDLYVDDIRAAHDEVLALGAAVLQDAEDLNAAHGFIVYADPAGHPFCLCWE